MTHQRSALPDLDVAATRSARTARTRLRRHSPARSGAAARLLQNARMVQDGSSMHVRVVAHITARPETLAAVREVLVGFTEPTRKEAGCISYELLQDNGDPCQFTFVEEWVSDEALDIHLQTPHLSAGAASQIGRASWR